MLQAPQVSESVARKNMINKRLKELMLALHPQRGNVENQLLGDLESELEFDA